MGSSRGAGMCVPLAGRRLLRVCLDRSPRSRCLYPRVRSVGQANGKVGGGRSSPALKLRSEHEHILPGASPLCELLNRP